MKKGLKIFFALLSFILIAVVIFAVLKNTDDTDDTVTYEITFETNGGSEIAKQNIAEGEKITRPEDPTKKDNLFLGWYCEATLENEFDFEIAIDKSYTIYAKYLDLSDITDTDSDGLIDTLEDYYFTDKTKIDTDSDNLSDYYEIMLKYNPLKKDSDGNGIEDANEDYDSDLISNIEEIALGTSPALDDTDGDGLGDEDEISTGLNPLIIDTDGDGANDYWEVKNSYNPLEANDTFSVRVVNNGASVEMNANGKAASTVTVEKTYLSNDFLTISGFLNSTYEFTTSGEFESAIIKIPYEGEISDTFQPRIYYYNESEQVFEELENQTVENGYIIAEVTHFSVYGAINKYAYDNSWKIEDTDIDKSQDSNGDGISDYYTQLIKEGKLLSSTGANTLTYTDFGASVDVDNDGIKNGEEVKIIENEHLGRAYYKIISNPISNDTDGDGIIDGLENEGEINKWNVSLRDLALLADIVYEDYKKGTKLSNMSFQTVNEDKRVILGSSSELVGWEVVCFYNDKTTGFQGSVYKNGNNVVIATRGSEDLLDIFSSEFYNDWLKADVVGFLTGTNPQVQSHKVFINEAVKYVDENTKLYVAGHSLGGYLALMTGKRLVELSYDDALEKLVTFNALGINLDPNTNEEQAPDVENISIFDAISGRMINYKTPKDFVSNNFGFHPGEYRTIPLSSMLNEKSLGDGHSLISFIERFANGLRHPSYDAFRNGLDDDGRLNDTVNPLPDTDTDTDVDTDTDIDTDIDTDTDTGADNPSDEPTVESSDLIYEYDADRDCYKVIDIGGYKDSVLVIPGEHNGKPVKIIGEKAFYECFNIQKVVLSEGIEIIEEGAFMHCPYIKTLVTCSTLYSVADDAFMDCWRLLEVYNLSPMISESDFENNYLSHYVKAIHNSIDEQSIYYEKGGFVFAYMYHNYTEGWYLVECKLNDYKIMLPESCQGEVYSIYDYAFYNYPEYTNLACLIVPKNVASIGQYAFFDNKKLVEIYNLSDIRMNAGVSNTANGGAARYAKVVHTSLDETQITEQIGDYVFATINGEKYLITYLGNEKNITLPTLEEGYKIYTGAFYMSHVESVVIPDGVTEIGMRAFDGCDNLLSITIPKSVTKMDSAFTGAKILAEIYNYSNIEILPWDGGTNYFSIINAMVVHTSSEKSAIDRIGDFVFVTVKNTNYLIAYLGSEVHLKLPESYKGEKYTVAEWCFALDKIKSVFIPKNVSCIKKSAFYENPRLENVYFEDTEGWYYTDSTGRITDIGSRLLETGEGGYQAINEYAWYYSIYNE